MKNFNEMTTKELKNIAKELKVSNWWTLRKDQLIVEIEKKMPKPEEKNEDQNKPKRGQLIEFNGKKQNICAWARELGISPNTLYGRLYRMNWTVERAFTTKK